MKTPFILPIAICLSLFFIIDSINGTCIGREVRNNLLAASGRGKIIISPLISVPGSAEVYKCMDADGQITFATKPGHECALPPGSVEKKPPPLKPTAPKPSRSATKPVDKTGKYQSPRCTTKDGYFACLEEKWLDPMSKFIIAEDYESINAYVSSKKCLSIRGGLTVTILEGPGMSGGKISFIYKGTKYWTYREAIKFR